jgi:hypothetical protein
METSADAAGATKEAETDHRIVAETLAELAVREACWRAERDAYARLEGGRAFEAWIAAVQAQFVTQAAEHYVADHPPWTFERVADVRLQGVAPEAAARAEWIRRLAARRAEGEADHPSDSAPATERQAV